MSAAWQRAALSFGARTMRYVVPAIFEIAGAGLWPLMMGAGDSMKQSGTGKLLAIALLGVVYGLFRHTQQMKWVGRGREAYLADQSGHFDKLVQYHALGSTLIACVILVALAAALYEVTAWGLTKMIPPSTIEE
jgi:hypothetical protein